MGVNLGPTPIANLRVGATQAVRAYLGTVLVWSLGSAQVWTRSTGSVTLSPASGAWAAGVPPRIWTGSVGTVTIAASSGTWGAAKLWTRSTATVTVTATSGTWGAARIFVRSVGTVTVLGTSGTWARAQVWTGSSRTVSVVGASSVWSVARIPVLKGASAVPNGTVAADLALINASWWYDWWNYSPGQGPEATPGIEFVPMVWGDWEAEGDPPPAISVGPASILLGYNEPDWVDQANMTVARALQLWPQLEATGARLGSPAPSDSPGSLAWLADFMNGDGAGYVPRVDFLCLHWYVESVGRLGPLDQYLDNMHALYGLPIWLTEVGTYSSGQSTSAAAIPQVMAIVNARPWVERIAWYSLRSAGAGTDIGLVSPTGTLTESGAVYATYPPGRVPAGVWTRSIGTVVVTGTSGTWSRPAAPQTWTRSVASVTVTATSGTWSRPATVAQTWTRSVGSVSITATSGAWSAATATGLWTKWAATANAPIEVDADSVTWSGVWADGTAWAFHTAADVASNDMLVEADVTLPTGTDWRVGVVARAGGTGTGDEIGYGFVIEAWQSNWAQTFRFGGAGWVENFGTAFAPTALVPGSTHKMGVKVVGSVVSIHWDGALVGSNTDTFSAAPTGLRGGVAAMGTVSTVAWNNLTVSSASAATVPDAPVLLTATPGNTTVALTWTAPNDGGAAITDYIVQRFVAVSAPVWTGSTGTVTVTGTSGTWRRPAAAFKSSLGSAVRTASNNTIFLNVTAPIAVGDLVVVRVSADNLTATTPTFTATDTGGNTYVTLVQLATQATAATGVAGGILTTKATAAVATGGTITVTLSGAVIASVMYAESFTGVNNTVRSTAVSAAGTGTTPAAPASGTVNGGDLVIGHAAIESNGTGTGDADTLNGPWSTAVSLANATGGTANSRIMLVGQYKIPGAPGAQTFNVTGPSSTDWVAMCVVLQVVP